jgi:hypothetical protein
MDTFIHQGCHLPNYLKLAFLKQFAKNKMIWPIGQFLTFFRSCIKSIFFGLILAKFQQFTFYNISNFI